MEKYTTGTWPLRRQSGCKEEGNPYSTRRVRTRLQTPRHFVASSIRKEGRVVYQKRRSRRALSRESRRNKQSRPMHIIPLSSL